jgi:hypothetical protein
MSELKLSIQASPQTNPLTRKLLERVELQRRGEWRSGNRVRRRHGNAALGRLARAPARLGGIDCKERGEYGVGNSASERLLNIGNQVVCVFYTYAEADEVGSNSERCSLSFWNRLLQRISQLVCGESGEATYPVSHACWDLS